MDTFTNYQSSNRVVFLFLFIGALISQECSSNVTRESKKDSIDDKTTKSTHYNVEFSDFLKKFKILSVPLTIKTLEIAVDSSTKLDRKYNFFIGSKYPNEIYAYGMLADTEYNYKVIWFEPTEIEVPVLTTFTKDGKKIKQEELGVGGCGSDCGFVCKEFITIDKHLTIFDRDSIKSTDCDSSGNLKENTTKKYIRYKTGQILKNGIINMTKVLVKSLD